MNSKGTQPYIYTRIHSPPKPLPPTIQVGTWHWAWHMYYTIFNWTDSPLILAKRHCIPAVLIIEWVWQADTMVFCVKEDLRLAFKGSSCGRNSRKPGDQTISFSGEHTGSPAVPSHLDTRAPHCSGDSDLALLHLGITDQCPSQWWNIISLSFVCWSPNSQSLRMCLCLKIGPLKRRLSYIRLLE